MLTIHYSPNSYYPDNVPNVYDIIRRHGKRWFVDNFPTSGDIATNDYLPIAIAGKLIRNGKLSPNNVRIIEYLPDDSRIVDISDNGKPIHPLDDSDQYQFHALFSE